MNNVWLKIIGTVVAIVIVVAVASKFREKDNETEETDQNNVTFYDQARQDREDFLTLPEPAEDDVVADIENNSDNNIQDIPAEEETAAIETTEPETITLYFKTLDMDEDVAAEQLLNTAVPFRSIARLPVTSYSQMIQMCRQIIERWPDSKYAYNAKKMLAEIPERYHEQFDITEEELDVSRYYEPRTGTQPYTITEE